MDRQFLDTLKNRTTRSLTTDEREQISEIAKDRPGVDTEINFDYRSAKIGPAAVPSVTALGKALTNPDLKGRGANTLSAEVAAFSGPHLTARSWPRSRLSNVTGK
jgi:hypothetical protein